MFFLPLTGSEVTPVLPFTSILPFMSSMAYSNLAPARSNLFINAATLFAIKASALLFALSATFFTALYNVPPTVSFNNRSRSLVKSCAVRPCSNSGDVGNPLFSCCFPTLRGFGGFKENLSASVISSRATAAASAGSAPSAISCLRSSLRSFVTAFLSAASFFLSTFGSLATFNLGFAGALRLVFVLPISLDAFF